MVRRNWVLTVQHCSTVAHVDLWHRPALLAGLYCTGVVGLMGSRCSGEVAGGKFPSSHVDIFVPAGCYVHSSIVKVTSACMCIGAASMGRVP